ncbi:hypothetical protein FQR65_LT19645 [Abscondita terminalis]|nr:hypothetical protein FQR65_LT19645 [Abscondita terminalis]
MPNVASITQCAKLSAIACAQPQNSEYDEIVQSGKNLKSMIAKFEAEWMQKKAICKIRTSYGKHLAAQETLTGLPTPTPPMLPLANTSQRLRFSNAIVIVVLNIHIEVAVSG